MRSKTFKILNCVIAGILAITVGWSVGTGNFILAITAMVLALGIVYFLRKRTREIMKDERTTLLYQKAAMITIGLCVPVMALVGVVLLALRERVSTEMAITGNVLAYIACILLLIHSAFYYYYARKL